MTEPLMSNALRHALTDLAGACRVLAMEGHEDGTQGHLSLRDPDGRGIWLKRMGVPLGDIHDADDFILIDFDGNQLAGAGRRHAEWPIHTEIMKARADVNVVGHGHPHFATLFTALNEEFRPFVQEGYRVRGHHVARFDDTSVLISKPELGRALATALGDHWAVFMRNHGVTYCGDTIGGAALNAIYLERACKAFFEIKATGLPIRYPDAAELADHAGVFSSDWFVTDNWGYFTRKLERHEQANAL